jgi:hypothetical protein
MLLKKDTPIFISLLLRNNTEWITDACNLVAKLNANITQRPPSLPTFEIYAMPSSNNCFCVLLSLNHLDFSPTFPILLIYIASPNVKKINKNITKKFGLTK